MMTFAIGVVVGIVAVVAVIAYAISRPDQWMRPPW